MTPTKEMLAGYGVTKLAELTHKAERVSDDLTFLAIQDEIERRPAAEQELYRAEWLRLIRWGSKAYRAGEIGEE